MKIIKYKDKNYNAIIETQVIDTGIGISPSRQKLLFKPFLELKVKQDFDKVKDKTTGIGLACS